MSLYARKLVRSHHAEISRSLSTRRDATAQACPLKGRWGLSARQWKWLGLALVVWACSVVSAFAQLPQTRLYAVFPPGAKVGTSVDLAVTRGDDLDELDRLVFSHPGIVAVPKTTDGPNGQKQPIPNQFTVSVAADVPPGYHEVRAAGMYGISNPRVFVVGTRPEIVEVEPNNAREQATPIEIGQTVNGRITGATDVDFLKFTGTPGQRILVNCVAKRIDSRLDSILELQDATGRRLAVARNSIREDALLDYTITEPGEYFLRLTDFVYAGSEDYFYRLTLQTSAWIDFVSPPAGVPGTTSKFTLFGRNLPNGQPADVVLDGRPLEKLEVDISLPAEPTQWPAGMKLEPYAAGVDGFAYSLATPEGLSNRVMIGYSRVPPVLESEPNNEPAQVQKIAVPGDWAGHFQQNADVDLYQFEAKAGEVVWVEVHGHRMGAGCDPYLTLDQVTTDDKGVETLKRLAAVDDEATNPLPIIFEALNDDPVYKFTAPADGTFRIALRDRYGASRGSPAMQYRLTLRRELPDFRVIVVTDSPAPANQKLPQTWSLGLRRGDQVTSYAIVLRQDGFDGDVDISVEGLPPGVTCRGISVGAKPSQGILVFESTEDAPAWTGTVRVVGKARVPDPLAVAAEATASAAIKPATDAVANADKALAKPAADLKSAEDAVAAVKQELAAKPDDEGIKKKLADAEAKAAAAKAANDAVVAAKAAADQGLKDAQTALAQAQAATKASIQELIREGRPATIAWNGANNVPGEVRLSQGLELSVSEEIAPFQVKTDVHRVIANHGRQILVPVQAIRREGFDADIAMTFVGQPQNVQIENKPVKKGAAEETFRVFVPANAPVGTYVMHLAAQAQVSYRRNPQKADRLKAEFDLAEKAAANAVEQQKAAVLKRDEATKAAATLAQTLKAATDAKTAADKVLVTAQAAEKVAAEAVAKAGDDAAAKEAAEKKLAEAQTAVKAATDAVTTAEQARVDAEAKSKAAEEAKVAAETAAKQSDELVKTTTAQKAAADKEFKAADTAAKAKNINFLPTTTPIVLTIKPAPCTVAVAPANGGKVKPGESVEVKVTVKRQNDFAGPVTLGIDLPKSIQGVTAPAVVIPADQTEGTLVVQVAADATEGALANAVVRATSEFDGEAMVDQPVSLTVAK